MAAGDIPHSQMIQFFIEENGYDKVKDLFDTVPGFDQIEAFKTFDEAEDNTEGWVNEIDNAEQEKIVEILSQYLETVPDSDK